MNNTYKRQERNRHCSTEVQPGIWQGRLRKTTQNLGKGIRSPSRYLNPRPPHYKAGEAAHVPRRSSFTSPLSKLTDVLNRGRRATRNMNIGQWARVAACLCGQRYGLTINWTTIRTCEPVLYLSLAAKQSNSAGQRNFTYDTPIKC